MKQGTTLTRGKTSHMQTHTHTQRQIRRTYGSEHKGGFLALEHPELFEVAQKVTKVNVEQVAVFGQHDVVIVSIADAQHVGGHAVAGARNGECLDGACKLLVGGVVLAQPDGQRLLTEGGARAANRLLCVTAEHGEWITGRRAQIATTMGWVGGSHGKQ